MGQSKTCSCKGVDRCLASIVYLKLLIVVILDQFISITDNTNGKTYYFTDLGEVWKFQREQDTARWTKGSSVIGSDEVEEIVEPDELEEINIGSIANKDDWLTF